MRRFLAIILCVSLLAALLAGCRGGEASTGTTSTDPTQTSAPTTAETSGIQAEDKSFSLAYFASEGFNPYTCTNINNRMLFSLLYQGLFTVDRQYNVEPMLCKSFTVSADMQTYTFVLEDATFSDGTYLRAEDVVASLNAARDNDYYGGRFAHVDSVEEVGENMVRINLDCAYENLPLLLDIPIVKSADVAATTPIGTGPYYIASATSGLYLRLRGSWWCDADLPLAAESIPLRAENGPTQIRDAFEFEDVGVSTADPGAASYAEYRCDYELWEAESGVFVYLVCKDNSSVFSDDQVRTALAFAIDRALLLDECYNGFGATATLAASPHSPCYDKSLAKQIYYEPDALKTAVAEANMVGKTVKLLVNKSDSVRLQTARRIAEMISASGLVVEILEHTTEEYKEVMRTGGYDLYLGQTKLSPNMDLSEFFAEKGTLRYGGLANDACYAMCLEALENSGNYYNLHQMVMRNGYLIPILFRTHSVYAQRGLTDDLDPSRDNIFWYSIGKSMEEARTLETEAEE